MALEGHVDAGLELRPIGLLRTLGYRDLVGQLALLVVAVLADGLLIEIPAPAFTPLRRDVPEGDILALAAVELQVKVCAVPITPVPPAVLRPLALLRNLVEEVEEWCVLLIPALEAEAVVLQVNEPPGLDCLRQHHSLLVLPLVLRGTLRNEVELQVLVAPVAVEVDVEVEGLPTVRDGAATEPNRLLR